MFNRRPNSKPHPGDARRWRPGPYGPAAAAAASGDPAPLLVLSASDLHDPGPAPRRIHRCGGAVDEQ